jgi:hypothetical protein
MATVTLPKIARELGLNAVELDFPNLPANRQEDLWRQGALYFYSAGFSHAKAKLNADRAEGEPERQLTREMGEEVVASVTSRLQDANWTPRTREGSGEEEVSAEQRAWESALLPLFRDKAKVLKNASKKAGTPAVTVRSLIEAAEGASVEEKAQTAYFQVGETYLRGIGQPEEKITGNLSKGFAKLRAQVQAVMNEDTF